MKKIAAMAAATVLLSVGSYLAWPQAARADYYNPGYSPYTGYAPPMPGYYPPSAYQSGGYNDPAFGYEPRGNSPHPYGPEPGGGFYHEGQVNTGHTD